MTKQEINKANFKLVLVNIIKTKRIHMNKKVERDLGKMISVRTPQHDKLSAIAKKEDRSLRSLIDRMIKVYEKHSDG